MRKGMLPIAAMDSGLNRVDIKSSSYSFVLHVEVNFKPCDGHGS